MKSLENENIPKCSITCCVPASKSTITCWDGGLSVRTTLILMGTFINWSWRFVIEICSWLLWGNSLRHIKFVEKIFGRCLFALCDFNLPSFANGTMHPCPNSIRIKFKVTTGGDCGHGLVNPIPLFLDGSKHDSHIGNSRIPAKHVNITEIIQKSFV